MAELQLVVFQIKPGGEESLQEFGVPITQVQEIIRLTTPTKIPNAPNFMEGIINLRGKVVPVIDLKKRFNVPVAKYNEDTRIIVVEISGQTVGIVVDAVSEVLRLAEEAIEPPPSFIAGIAADYLTGVGKISERLLILLDLDKIFTIGEKKELLQVGQAG
ncbi:MAG: chemotaxis protein CheW [Bacillota bacterium]|nr:chemotaxis protein CheW [Bacillota bacterium]